MQSSYIALIPALPLAGALINLLLGRYFGRAFVHFVAVFSVFAAFFVSAWLVGGPLWEAFTAWREADKVGPVPEITQNLYTWIEVGRLKIDLAFRIDTLSAVMILVVTGVGTLIHWYSTGYMADEPRYAAYFGYLNLFTGAMLILVLANNLPVMFIGWEGVGLCSYLLIGFWFTNESYATAGRKAFVVNRIGDFAFLLGMFLIFQQVGTLTFTALDADAVPFYEASYWLDERMAAAAGILLFIGACGKSAQIPLYVWLPDAMAGPTPVSALIHAATMVTAGVYLIARLSWLFASSTTAMIVVATVGALTALLAAIMAFAQTDFKKVLAYSTVSQLGFMFVGVGVGAYVAGIFHLVTHAFFKAGLFLAAGSVMHAMSGSGDIMKMGGLKKWMPVTRWTTLIFTCAIAGVPLLSGWFSKDEILAATWAADHPGWMPYFGVFLWAVLSLAALGTAFYMFRLYFLVFEGDNRSDPEVQSHIHESPWSMTGPLVILAVLAGFAGFLGIPHLSFLHVPNVIGDWLAPSINTEIGATLHLGDTGILLLLAIATLIGLIGIACAWLLYRDGPSERVERWRQHPAFERLYQVSYNKFYVDEFYDKVIVRPFSWAARATFEFIDRFVIDLIFVNGSAFVFGVASRISAWVQNGQVQRYLVALLIGGAVIFWVAGDSDVDFDHAEGPGNRVRFQADVGDGPAAEIAGYAWDFDGDGQPDATEANPVYTFPRPGTYRVRLEIANSMFGDDTRTVEKTITVVGKGPVPEVFLDEADGDGDAEVPDVNQGGAP
jgi:NADH-quinone oxidoreductase subunit L